jgi:hypothetical protein
MSKSKKSESLKPGDIVTQGRSRHELRVLQVNKGGAVLVETVKTDVDHYATFYAPKDDLRPVKASSAKEEQPAAEGDSPAAEEDAVA